MEKIIEERKVCYCPVCGTPLFEKAGFKIFFLQHHKNRDVRTEIDRAAVSYCRFNVACGACGKGGYKLLYAKGGK